MSFISLYIHIPFCIHRCGYCDFNTYAGLLKLIPGYVEAVCSEITYLSASDKIIPPVHTIYFGGGTPSLVPSEDIEKIIFTIRHYFELSPEVEITLEANPGTVSAEYLSRLREAGVNRLSLGMQSAHQEDLTMLERQHSFPDVVNAVKWARLAGINNLNLDLIFGLPNQELYAWMDSLEKAISLQPEHLSLYALTLEHGTPLKHKVEAGLLTTPDEDLAADMYESARDRLWQAGFRHYEISNWARRNDRGEIFACKHNLQYWRTLPWLGIGAGAHGFIHGYRTENVASPVGYVKRVRDCLSINNNQADFPATPATILMNHIDQNTEISEMMMMGLRLVEEGVSDLEFQQRYGSSLREKFGPQIERMIAFGLLEWHKMYILRLTQRGQLLGNQVFSEFI